MIIFFHSRKLFLSSFTDGAWVRFVPNGEL